MPRKPSETLTGAELRLMDILWQRGSATVNAVMEDLPPDSPLAYNTVLTTLRILERKGYVRHQKNSRAFEFVPVIDHREASQSAVSYVVNKFFRNSPKALVLRILEDQKLDPGQLQRLRQMMEESKVK
jgi:predicted transcriptional regulator